MIKRLPVVRKTGGAVWHQAFALRFANRDTQVGFARTTKLTLAALCGVKWDHMVAGFDAGYAFTDFNYNPGPFVTENHWEDTFRVIAGEGKCVGMANTGMGDFNQHFTFSVVQRQFQRFPAVYREQMQRQHVISSLALPQYGNRFSYLR